MIIQKTTEQWNTIVKEKDDRIKLLETKLKNMVNKNLALYSHIRSVQDINDAHQKLNGVLQRKLSEVNNKLEKTEKDRLNAGRKAGIDV
tara:strand:- start:682 stop:948 length:267 start_codon:yes stop_codon:yes gene_type:complete